MKLEYLLALLAVIATLAGAVYFGYQPLSEAITLGLDIKGGVTVLLEADLEEVEASASDTMARALAIISNRVNSLGVTEPEVQREGINRIRISLPGYDNQEEVLSIIGKTALLEFRDAEGNVFLTGSNLVDAREQNDPRAGGAYVEIRLDQEGGTIMREYTKKNLGGFLLITLDGELISYPSINEEVGAEGMISGLSSLEEARDLAIMLRSGALPVALNVLESRAVGPTLGQIYLEKSVQAGAIGLALVLLVMLLYYRTFGLLADVALTLYTVLTLALLAALNATLTLPGIAGIILGVGMAVDANVIIFERIKEELREGRTLRGSVKAGFHRATLTVVDSNVTTLIAAGALYYFGTGPIRGFAVTLSLSIVVSMFTAVFFTRILVNLLVNANLTKSAAILGLGGGVTK
ncbi:MAG: protein translocase subunit SecD [Bacillota bacterium]|jgi:preprotein translocase subunit SecD